MAEAVAARIRRYILDGSDQDLRRLLTISQVTVDMVRAALVRAGAREGWSAIDCGCGPLGALAVLADAVGQTGRVVGVDVNPAAVERAQAVASALELSTVKVVAGDPSRRAVLDAHRSLRPGLYPARPCGGIREIHAATLAALRDRATGMGIAADRIDGLAGELLTAKDGGYEWVSSPFFLDLTLRKPLG